MLANWVEEYTTTTGTGTINLGGATAASIAFSDYFSTGDLVHYSIEDGSNREIGIGTLTTGTPWTLARTIVLETLVSGSYTDFDSSPTAITLSGNAVVGVTANRNQIIGNIVNPWLRILSANYDLPDNIDDLNTAAPQPVANRMQLYAGILDSPRQISTITFNVQTADASTTNLRLGIYKTDAYGMPTDLILDSGDLSSYAAATGFNRVTLGTAIYLKPGHYWFAGVSDSTTLVLSGLNPSKMERCSGGFNVNSSDRRKFPYETGVTGALPSTVTIGGDVYTTTYGFGWQP
jgi:hypothetical protein